MVYLLCKDATLCCLLDSALAACLTHTFRTHVRAIRSTYVAEALARLRTVMPPSQLGDALWLLLHLKLHLLKCDDDDEDATHSGLHTSDEEGSVLQSTAALSEAIGQRCSSFAQLEKLLQECESDTAAHSPSADKDICGDEADVAEERALRTILHMLQSPKTANSSSSNSSNKAQGEENNKKEEEGEQASAAVHAPVQRRHVHAVLQQPQVMAVLVRTYEELWCCTRLCKQLKLLYMRRVAMLTGRPVKREVQRQHTKKSQKEKNSRCRGQEADTSSNNEEDQLPADEYVHDYEVLLPFRMVEEVVDGLADITYTLSSHTTSNTEGHAGRLTLPVLFQLCRTSAPSIKVNKMAHSPIALILNPACAPADNPLRALKNRRVDLIEAAAMNYYYERMAHHTLANSATTSTSGEAMSGAAALQAHYRHEVSLVDARQMSTLAEGDKSTEQDTRRSKAEAFRQQRSTHELLQQRESYASFMKDVGIGFDIQLMSLTGAAVGYYLGYVRGASGTTCILYAVVGLVSMMLVDACLLLIRLGREDEAVRRRQRRMARARAKLPGVRQVPVTRTEEATAAAEAAEGKKSEEAVSAAEKKLQ